MTLSRDITNFFDFLGEDYDYYIGVKKEDLNKCVMNVYDREIIFYVKNLIDSIKEVPIYGSEYSVILFKREMHYNNCFLLNKTIFINYEYLVECVKNDSDADMINDIMVNVIFDYYSLPENDHEFDKLLCLYKVRYIRKYAERKNGEYSNLTTYKYNKHRTYIANDMNGKYYYNIRLMIDENSKSKYCPYYDVFGYLGHGAVQLLNKKMLYDDITLSLIKKIFFQK